MRSGGQVCPSHGAMVGELDADQLFYLRSRGIPDAQARSILVRAFLAEALELVTDETVRGVLDRAVRLAELTKAAGLDGVVASARETAVIRQRCGASFTIVTPGIRGGGAGVAGTDDQERTMGPREAIAAGASYIVVGRPVIAAADPRDAARRIVEEMKSVILQ